VYGFAVLRYKLCVICFEAEHGKEESTVMHIITSDTLIKVKEQFSELNRNRCNKTRKARNINGVFLD
jgi:hypothetical protein